jgi:hypothetical protein
VQLDDVVINECAFYGKLMIKGITQVFIGLEDSNPVIYWG